jgi:hypothetical protein
LLRICAGSIAFAIAFIFHMWLTHPEMANTGSRAEARDSSVSGGIHFGAHLKSLQSALVAELAFGVPGNRSELPSAHSFFAERFLFDDSNVANSSAQPSNISASFHDRFVGVAFSTALSAMVQTAVAPHRAAAPRIAAAVPVRRSRSATAQAMPQRPLEPRVRLASASDTSAFLAYAPSDAFKISPFTSSAGRDLAPKDLDAPADVETSRTAIYDITARTVYLPNGRRLEAHSGFGTRMDDPRYVKASDTGPTPPNVYELKLRETPFHGVRAIRLIPTDRSRMYGREGMLAHSYLLGPNGQSNGCVSFRDYPAFLDAFERGEVNRLIVVDSLADAPSPKTASDWLSNKVRDIFRRS